MPNHEKKLQNHYTTSFHKMQGKEGVLIEHRFTLKLRIKDCELLEGYGKAVLVAHEISIKAPEDRGAQVTVSLLRACDEMRDKYIEIVIEPGWEGEDEEN